MVSCPQRLLCVYGLTDSKSTVTSLVCLSGETDSEKGSLVLVAEVVA